MQIHWGVKIRQHIIDIGLSRTTLYFVLESSLSEQQNEYFCEKETTIC